MAFHTRLGLRLPTRTAASGAEAVLASLSELCAAAESSGFDTLWVPDRPHHVLGGGTEEELEAYTVLGALATRTSRARLGALVTSVGWRSPSIAAKQVTTVDLLSDGRAVLGLGAGRGDDPLADGGSSDRLEVLEDALRICRAMFDDEAPTVAGRRLSVAGAANRPRPVQPTGVPIVVDGTDPERSLPLAVALADGCNLVGPADALAEGVDAVARLCERHGRDRAGFSVTALVTAVVGTRHGEAEERFGRLAVPPRRPAPPMLLGTPAVVAEALAPVFASGVDGVVIEIPTGTDPDAVSSLGTALGERFD